MMLNLGCGDHRAPAPWVNIDRWPGVHPDVVASADALPFRSGSVERLYCGHLLEHLEWETELPEALAEIRRVTDSACFVGPDYDRAQANPEHHVLLSAIVCGGSRWPGDTHRWVSTEDRSLDAIWQFFPNAHPVDIYDMPDWPVVTPTGWQFAIVT